MVNTMNNRYQDHSARIPGAQIDSCSPGGHKDTCKSDTAVDLIHNVMNIGYLIPKLQISPSTRVLGRVLGTMLSTIMLAPWLISARVKEQRGSNESVLAGFMPQTHIKSRGTGLEAIYT